MVEDEVGVIVHDEHNSRQLLARLRHFVVLVNASYTALHKGTVSAVHLVTKLGENIRRADAVNILLEKEGIAMASAEVTMIPQNYVTLTNENDIKYLNKTLDLLDADDDVQNVYHNWDE